MHCFLLQIFCKHMVFIIFFFIFYFSKYFKWTLSASSYWLHMGRRRPFQSSNQHISARNWQKLKVLIDMERYVACHFLYLQRCNAEYGSTGSTAIQMECKAVQEYQFPLHIIRIKFWRNTKKIPCIAKTLCDYRGFEKPKHIHYASLHSLIVCFQQTNSFYRTSKHLSKWRLHCIQRVFFFERLPHTYF